MLIRGNEPRRSEGHEEDVFIAAITAIEITAAINRRSRAGSINIQDAITLVLIFIIKITIFVAITLQLLKVRYRTGKISPLLLKDLSPRLLLLKTLKFTTTIYDAPNS
jgi:hypothetical protein